MKLLKWDNEEKAHLQPVKAKLPMHKDPVFLAGLRKAIIDDHNKKIEKKKALATNEGS